MGRPRRGRLLKGDVMNQAKIDGLEAVATKADEAHLAEVAQLERVVALRATIELLFDAVGDMGLCVAAKAIIGAMRPVTAAADIARLETELRERCARLIGERDEAQRAFVAFCEEQGADPEAYIDIRK